MQKSKYKPTVGKNLDKQYYKIWGASENQNDNEDNGCNQLIASCSNDKSIKIWKGCL